MHKQWDELLCDVFFMGLYSPLHMIANWFFPFDPIKCFLYAYSNQFKHLKFEAKARWNIEWWLQCAWLLPWIQCNTYTAPIAHLICAFFSSKLRLYSLRICVCVCVFVQFRTTPMANGTCKTIHICTQVEPDYKYRPKKSRACYKYPYSWCLFSLFLTTATTTTTIIREKPIVTVDEPQRTTDSVQRSLYVCSWVFLHFFINFLSKQ